MAVSNTNNHRVTCLLESLRCPCRPNHDNNSPGTLGNVEKRDLESRESKLLDNKVGENTETTNDKVRHRDEHKATPNERVLECFEYLVLLVLFVLYTGLVVSYPFYHQNLVLFAETLRRYRTIGKKSADEK